LEHTGINVTLKTPHSHKHTAAFECQPATFSPYLYCELFVNAKRLQYFIFWRLSITFSV